ncbi:MAG TPA: hypothetical protein VFS00_22955 [Polyangiaceae bacterium]|nr:hypothetical protein [Polyangiaceae bacterium]
MTWRSFSVAACGLALFAACGIGYEVDLEGFCALAPDDVECVGRAGSAGAAGLGGMAGAPEMGTGGGPLMGAAGAGMGGGGAGGSGGIVCTGPEVECGGACVDVKAENAANCGACGRTCLGAATCAAGACVPEAMATGEVAPYALVEDGTSLYWVSPAIRAGGAVNDARMRRVGKASAGGAAENVFDSTRVRARSLGFAEGKLYWGELGASPSDFGNQKLVAGAPAGDPTTVASDQAGIEHLTLGNGLVYWLLGGGTGTVRGKAADGSGDIAPQIAFQTNPRWVVVDADAVPYWVANATGGQREVRRTVSPSAAEAVASEPDVVAVELTVDRYYWADRAAGTVQSRPKAAPTEAPREEFGGQGAVEGFRVEGATLYVLTVQGRQLRAWRKGPGDEAPFLLGEVEAKAEAYAGNPFGAAYVLVDAQYLYFADVGTFLAPTPDLVQVSAGDGVVYRVAK